MDDQINYLIQFITKSYNTQFIIIGEELSDGWRINLRERTLFPRLIQITKNEKKESFMIQSFEIIHKAYPNSSEYREGLNKLYESEEMLDMESLIKELKEILFGKDLLHSMRDIRGERTS